MRAAMTMMLGFVVLSEVIGSEIILGAFLAGAASSALSRRQVRGQLGMKLDAIGFGFFIPIFFIMVGVRFDIQSLLVDTNNLWLVPLLVTFAFLVKVVPTMLLSRFYGKRNALAAGFLLSSRLSLIIAASEIGLRLGMITPEINTAIILVAIVTCVVSPATYARLRGQPGNAGNETVDLEGLIGHVVKKKAGHLALHLVEISARRLPFACSVSLQRAKLRARTGLTLIAIVHRDGSVVANPDADSVVDEQDTLLLVGTESQVLGLEAATASGEWPAPPS